jgi:hypothetical protein
VSDLAAVLADLRRPFKPEAIKWKIQTNPKPEQNKKAMIVAHIDARLVAARLNTVAPDWSDSFNDGLHGSVICRLTVCGHTRCDVGWAEVADSNGLITDAGIKGIYSDAFKRAAVQFGVGAFLYSLPRQYAAADQLKHLGRSWYLTPALENKLRGSYAKWLKDTGIKDFGEPFDHGSVASDASDDAETPAPADAGKLGRSLAGSDDDWYGDYEDPSISLDKVRALRGAVTEAGANREELGLLLVTAGVENALVANLLAAESITKAQAKKAAALLTDEQASAVLAALESTTEGSHNG